jgi:hypothetical protein
MWKSWIASAAAGAWIVLAAPLCTNVPASAEAVNNVWQDWAFKSCKNQHRCEVYFKQVSNAQTVTSISCVIENSTGGAYPSAMVLGSGVNNANFKPKWDQDGAYIPVLVTFNNGFKFQVLATTLYAVKAVSYPAIRADFDFDGDIVMHCTIAGPNNQP